MPEVLGRVTARSVESPRGPDVNHRIRVRRDWLGEGAVVEFELPRNLTCAVCEGGGCDACERSGAVTMRGRDEPPEIIQVTLPKHSDETTEGRGLVIRIPEQGGLSAQGSNLPRGLLFLRVIGADEADVEVRLVGPPSMPAQISQAMQAAQQSIASVIPPRSARLLFVIVVVCLFVAFGAYIVTQR